MKKILIALAASIIANVAWADSIYPPPSPCSGFGTTTGTCLQGAGALGTPSSGTATNLTGTAAGLTAGSVTTNANLTGAVTSVGNAASLGSFSSANLSGALTDKTGFGDSGRYEQFGLGAEEVALVDERLVGRDPNGNLQGVRYQEMTAVLAGAIQQLKADNDNLRECNNNWKCRIFGQ